MDYLFQPPTIEYCEVALNAVIARPWYALSNAAFFIVGITMLLRGGGQARTFGGLALLVGMLSLVYDSVFTYVSQLLDLSGMLLLIGYLLYLNLASIAPRRQLIASLLGVGFVVSLCLIIWFKGYAGNVVFAVATLSYVVSEIYLIRTKRHTHARLWVLAFIVFSVGVVFWLSDAAGVYCADIGLLNGRAVFHYTNAVAMYLLYRFYRLQ